MSIDVFRRNDEGRWVLYPFGKGETLDLVSLDFHCAIDRQRIISSQRTWLKQSNDCTNTTCLHQAYERRLAILAATLDSAPTRAAEGGLTHTERTITDEGPYYSVKVSYPIFRDPLMAAANRTIRDFAQGFVTSFVGEHREDSGVNYPKASLISALPPALSTISRPVAIARSRVPPARR